MARTERQGIYNDVLILCDSDTSISLPNPLTGYGPMALGTEYTVMDNNLSAGSHTITITGPIGSTSPTATATITSAGGSQTFIWMGNAYSAAIQ